MEKLKCLLVLVLFFLSSPIFANDTTIVVHFSTNQATISTHEQAKILNSIQPKITAIQNVMVLGHTDQIGSEKYNQQLSTKRAKTVQQFLIANGINANLITIVEGKGKTELLTNLADAKSKQLNRRVTIQLNYTVEPDEDVIITPKQPEKIEEKDKKSTKTTLTTTIKDTATKQGDNLVLKNINFIGGRHIFLEESFVALQELYEAMNEIPTLKIDIQGHICCQETNEDGTDLDTGTKDLSVRRAKAVYDFLIGKGINKDRMSFRGFARRNPLVEETSEENRRLNRRVEIKILSK